MVLWIQVSYPRAETNPAAVRLRDGLSWLSRVRSLAAPRSGHATSNSPTFAVADQRITRVRVAVEATAEQFRDQCVFILYLSTRTC